MRHLPTVLLVLAMPVGLVGYFAGAAVVNAVLPGGGGIIGIFVPLLVAGLCMIPFIAPWLDRRAKADLEAIRLRREAEGNAADVDAPGGDRPA